jgi:hypothetical protein
MDDDGIEKRDRQQKKRQRILDQKIEQSHFPPLGEPFENRAIRHGGQSETIP